VRCNIAQLVEFFGPHLDIESQISIGPFDGHAKRVRLSAVSRRGPASVVV
jgi:hypothetical protein